MRAAATYRGARRNMCLRELHHVWGPDWYYAGHRAQARYVPAARHRRKQATSSNAIHTMLKRGDYAGAVRAFFSRKGKATGRGD